MKTTPCVHSLSVDGKNGAFQKRLRHNSLCKTDTIAGAIGVCVSNRKNVREEHGDKNVYLDHRFLAPSVDVRQRCEGAFYVKQDTL